jgi:hypothetical protein
MRTCYKRSLLTLLALLSPRLCYSYDPRIYTCPSQYSYVAYNFMPDEQTIYGDTSNWNKIVLWGRLDKYPGPDWSYRWDFGYQVNGTEVVDSWKSIDDPDSVASTPLSRSSRYLKSSVQTGYPVPSVTQPVDFYNAKLQLKDSGGAIYDSKTIVQVKVVNMRGIDETNGYDDPPSKLQRRTIIESIAKGRGLRYIYLMQRPVSGSWQDATACRWDKFAAYGDSFPGGATALCLCAFLIYGHGVDATVATDDIFVETVNSGFNYLGTQTEISGEGQARLIGLHSSWPRAYEHGISMLALAAATGFKKYLDAVPMVYRDSNPAAPVPLFQSTDLAGYTYREILQGAANYAADMQKRTIIASNPDEFKYIGGWRYEKDHTEEGPQNTIISNTDLSCSQWPTLGLTAINDNWEISPDPTFKVRYWMLKYIRFCQFRSDDPNPFTSPDGVADYLSVNIPTGPGVSYNDNQLLDSTGFDIADPIVVSMRLTGVNSLLQMCYYMSLDDNTLNPQPHTVDYTCYCSNTNHCTSQATDFQIDQSDAGIVKSCERVKHAFDFMARFIARENFNNYYTMYGNMKALRLYDIQRQDCKNNPGLHNGKLYYYGNFTYPLDTREPYDWEQEYIQHVLQDGPNLALDEKDLDPYGVLAWTVNLGVESFSPSDYDRSLETSFAMLLLAPTVFEPITLRTNILNSKFDHQVCGPRPAREEN